MTLTVPWSEVIAELLVTTGRKTAPVVVETDRVRKCALVAAIEGDDFCCRGALRAENEVEVDGAPPVTPPPLRSRVTSPVLPV